MEAWVEEEDMDSHLHRNMMTEYNASIVVESSVRLLHKGIYHHASKE
jgi:hypothetical protein